MLLYVGYNAAQLPDHASIHRTQPGAMVDTAAPAYRWEYDILTLRGEEKLHKVVEAIKTSCAKLTS